MPLPTPPSYPVSMPSNVSNHLNNDSIEQHYWSTTMSFDSTGTTMTSAYSGTNTGFSNQSHIPTPSPSWTTDSPRPANEPQLCSCCGTTKSPLWQSNGNIMFMCMHCKGMNDMKKMREERARSKQTNQEVILLPPRGSFVIVIF